MDLAAVRANYNATQAAFTTLAAIQLTAYLWPPNAQVHDGAVYDYIVVGAGTAGCVVASRLSEIAENRVLLIEAGGDPPLESVVCTTCIYISENIKRDSKTIYFVLEQLAEFVSCPNWTGLMSYVPYTENDWNFTSASGPAERCYQQNHLFLTRGHMLGGSSAINYMVYIRGNVHDYDQYAEIADDVSWKWSNILHYFKKGERLEDSEIILSQYGAFHGTMGYLGVTRQLRPELEKYLDAFHEAGYDTPIDLNAGINLGYVQPTFTIAEGSRQSTAFAYLRPAVRRRNLDVLKNTLVTKIFFDKYRRAIGVKALTENHETIIIKASKEVIISAGALKTPQLLMLSGIGPADHLSEFGIPVVANLPVGHNLQDHLGTNLFFKIKDHKYPPRTPIPTEFPLPLLTGYATIHKGQTFPDYQTEIFEMEAGSSSATVICAISLRLKDDICERLNRVSQNNKILYIFLNIMQPKSRGRITLQSTDPKDSPIFDLGYYTNEEDLDDMVEYITDFLRVTNTSYFKYADAQLLKLDECGCENLNLDRYWRCYAFCIATTNWHYVGTAAMGSVVDSRLRVRGVTGLRVADASVFPIIPRANTNAPTIMIGEKAADMILHDDII